MAEKRSSLGSSLMFTGMLVLGIGLFSLIMYLFGARLDNQDPAAEPPTSAEVQRQAISVDISRIRNLAEALATDDLAGPSALARSASEAATQWLTETGDVWVPWPNGAPQGYTNPPLDTEPTTVSVSALAEELTSLSDVAIGNTALDASTSVAIASSARQYAYALEQASGADAEALSIICPAPNLSLLGPLLADGIALKNIETAHQWLESDVAQKPYDQRESALRRTADYQLLIESMLDAGAPDTRPAIVDAPESDAVADAYNLTAQQLVFAARRADAATRSEIVNFLCAFTSYGAMPELPALPGLPSQAINNPSSGKEKTS